MSCSKLVQQLYKNTTCKTGVRYLAEEICKHRIEGAYQFLTAYSNRKKNRNELGGGTSNQKEHKTQWFGNISIIFILQRILPSEGHSQSKCSKEKSICINGQFGNETQKNWKICGGLFCLLKRHFIYGKPLHLLEWCTTIDAKPGREKRGNNARKTGDNGYSAGKQLAHKPLSHKHVLPFMKG